MKSRKNKRGFTLIETIVVIVILVAVAGIFSVNMINTLNKNKKEENKTVVKQIYSAAEAYVSTNPEAVERLYNGGYGYVDIPIGNLRDAGFLSENLKNVETGSKIDDKAIVRVRYETGEYLTYQFPVTTEEQANTEAYTLEADPLYIDHDPNGSTDWCSSETNYFEGLYKDNIDTVPSSKLYLVNSKGEPYTGDYKNTAKLKKQSCNVNPSIAGTYSIVYEFVDPSLNTVKTKERKVYVGTSTSDVVSFEAEINNGKKIIINTDESSIPISIKVTDKSGDTKPLPTMTIGSLSGYTIDKFSTDSVGNYTAIVKSITKNSDGSTPKPYEANYEIVNSLTEALGTCGNNDTCYITCSASNNYVKYNGTTFRIYAQTTSGGIPAVKLIYDGVDKKGPYGQLGNCSPMSCCNGGRSMYKFLGDTKGDGMQTTMDENLELFYNANSIGNNAAIDSMNTKYGYRKIALLSYAEYRKISNNGACPSNYVTKNITTGDGMWLLDAAQNYQLYGGAGKQPAYVYNYAVTRSGAIVTDVYGSHKESGTGNLYASSATTDRLVYKPVIQLKNPKISGGNGTSSNPYVIE